MKQKKIQLRLKEKQFKFEMTQKVFYFIPK